MNKEEKTKKATRTFLIVLNIILFVIFIGVLLWPQITNSIRYEWKPIIYIYPKEDTNVKISLSHPENLSVTYPKYEDGWEVRALKDGTLMDSNSKKYYALYWESKKNQKNPMKEDGFVVKRKDTISFLEEKLEILGLNYKESNEFIMYWLPILEKSNYNYIRFQTMEEINENMELIIDPKPDTLIRVRMEYKPLKEKINVKEQKLTKVEREGYTVVEWGGCNIN